MIYFIEGCTCAGKSTLATKLALERNIPVAPEHTPPPLNTTPSIVERQQLLFADFVGQFTAMIASKKDYIADFSPWGVIPFSRAYSRFLGLFQNQDSEALKDLISLADTQHNFMNHFNSAFKNHIKCVKYLSADAELIKKRLQQRARAGDECWADDFINILVEEYNSYFANFEIEE